MRRGLALALLAAVTCAAAAQQPGVLQIRIVLSDAAGPPGLVPRHALLVSGNPPDAPPRRVVTGPDGTATVNLSPGNYTVESDQPIVFQGRALSWLRTVEVASGARTVLDLTTANAESRADVPTAAAAAPSRADLSTLLLQWAPRVVGIWTPTSHLSGLVVEERGLIVTSHRGVGSATSVEVQVTPSIKVTGQVLLADAARDLAVVRVHPSALSPLASPAVCAQPANRPLAVGQDVLAIGVRLGRQRDVEIGEVRSVGAQAPLVALNIDRISPGGPAFTDDGALIGISTAVDAKDERLRDTVRIVRIDQACEVVRTAEPKLADGPVPDSTHLAVEPVNPFPAEALATLGAARANRFPAAMTSASDFEVAFITPVDLSAWRQSDRQRVDFSNWSAYVADAPPVLLVRVTPKQVESVWMKLARGAAWTQGAALPPIKRFTAGFARLRAFCGAAEVTPIHRFRLELRLSETDGTYEGLSVFDPGALGPPCGTVRLELFSEKAPERADHVDVDPKTLARVWQDFEPYRAPR